MTLERQQHSRGCTLEIIDENPCELVWENVVIGAGYEDDQNRVENAGYCMACLLIYKFFGFEPLSRKAKSEGVDLAFVDTKSTPDPNNFLSPDPNTNILCEVKAISRKTKFNQKVKEAFGQFNVTDSNASILIQVTEFESPKAKITRWR